MLDENLPTFHFKPSSDNPLTNVVYFTQHGDEPAPEYLFKRADPAQPASRNKYAAALADPYSPDVIYAECVVEPEWTQPTLSSAELRVQAQNPNPVPAVPTVPDGFTLQLYNPDQTISFKMSPGSWNRTESWEFEMPTHSFRLPTTSEVDRQQIASPTADLTPKIMFRWKKDGRLSKDMTCYMTGKSVGGRKSKEPDITVALFKQARDSALTIYEPNLKRVEVEDRKGLDIVLALSSEVIKDLYLVQRHDVFNISGTPPADKRKNSRPLIGVAPSPPTAMSGAIGAAPSTTQAQAIPSQPPHGNTAMPPSPAAAASSAAIDAETRRLQAMVEKEEREREMRDRAEQKRIKKMLEDEERERRRREAEVAKETERLRKKYGVEGQDLPSSASSSRPHGSPPLPPRSQQQPQQLSPHPGGGGWFGQHAPPPRPVSAGPAPAPGPFNNPTLNSWWGGPTAPAPVLYPPTQPTPQGGSPGHGRRRTGGGSGSVPNTHNPTTSVSQFFHLNRSENSNDRQKIQKKRSMQW